MSNIGSNFPGRRVVTRAPRGNLLPSLTPDGVKFGITFEFGVRLAPDYVVWLVAAVATLLTGVQYF
jgi:hypothetical protein